MKKRREHEDFKLESLLGLILITVALCTARCESEKATEPKTGRMSEDVCNNYVSMAKRKACIESVDRWEKTGY